jgi:hypothetical protein
MPKVKVSRNLIDDDYDYNVCVKKVLEYEYEHVTVYDTNGFNEINKFLKDTQGSVPGLASPAGPLAGQDPLRGPLVRPKVLIVRGPIGCGKVTLIRKSLEQSGYIYTEFNQEFDDISELTRTLASVSMSTFFGITKPRAVIIRDFENSLSPRQTTDLFNFIRTNHTEPLIIVCHKKIKLPDSFKAAERAPMGQSSPVRAPVGDPDPQGAPERGRTALRAPMVREIVIKSPEAKDLLEIGSFCKDPVILKKCIDMYTGDIRNFIESLELGSLKDTQMDTQTKLMNIAKGTLAYDSLYMSEIRPIVYNNYLFWTPDPDPQRAPERGRTALRAPERVLKNIADIADTYSFVDVLLKNEETEKELDYTNQLMADILGSVYPIYKRSGSGSIRISDFKLKNLSDIKNQPVHIFTKLDELNYSLKYIVDPKDYKEFIIHNNIVQDQIKSICNGLDPVKIDTFKKIFKNMFEEY